MARCAPRVTNVLCAQVGLLDGVVARCAPRVTIVLCAQVGLLGWCCGKACTSCNYCSISSASCVHKLDCLDGVVARCAPRVAIVLCAQFVLLEWCPGKASTSCNHRLVCTSWTAWMVSWQSVHLV